jgi:hypothetical protein
MALGVRVLSREFQSYNLQGLSYTTLARENIGRGFFLQTPLKSGRLIFGFLGINTSKMSSKC